MLNLYKYLSIFLKYLYVLNIKVSLFSKSVHVSTSLILIVLIRLFRERRRSFHLSLSILFLPKGMTKTFLLYRCEMHKYGNPSSLPRLLFSHKTFYRQVERLKMSDTSGLSILTFISVSN